MTMLPPLAALLCPALLCAAAAAQEPACPPFADGERVVFFGDSITQGGRYVQELEAFYATRFPRRRIAFENAGIGGSAVGGSLTRIPDDVLGRRPTRVMLLFGANDVGMALYKVEPPDAELARKREGGLNWYANSLTAALRRFAEAGVPVTVLSPPPYDQYSRTLPAGDGLVSVNEGLARLAARGKGIAGEAGAPFIDLTTPLTRIVAAGPSFTWAQDRIHPGAAGHLLIARLILAAQGFDGPLASVEVDAAGRPAGAAVGCAVDQVAADGPGLSFTYRAEALPFPVVQPEYRDADGVLAWSDLNREVIRVRGLPPGDWTLEVDGAAVGRFPAAAFATGVDIAALDTPQQAQARAIRALIARKAGVLAPLRSIALVRQWLAERKADPADPAAVEAALAAVLEKAGPHRVHFQRSIDAYRAALGRQADIQREAQELQARIAALQTIAARTLRLRPAGGAP